jgi:hypothetical protein
VVVSEVFTMRTKAVAAPIATAVLFAAGAVGDITFLSAYTSMGAYSFLVYAVISFTGALCVCSVEQWLVGRWSLGWCRAGRLE